MANEKESSNQAHTGQSCDDEILYVGIDNGVSGSIAYVNLRGSKSGVYEIPTFSEQDYMKKKQNVTRIDVKKMKEIFESIAIESICVENFNKPCIRIFLERPLVNPMRFRATLSAVRAWEATLIALSDFRWSYIVIDSRAWQKALLPEGIKGPDLKVASCTVGKRLFPDHSDWIDSHRDADSLLIAEHARRNKL